MIEVELRGELIDPHAEQFKSYLEEIADKKESYKDIALFCNTDHLENFGSFVGGSARIQANQKVFKDGSVIQKIKMKTGVPSGDVRQEYEINIPEKGLKDFFEILKRFGVHEASFRACERHDYQFGNIEVSLKFGHVVGDHFEIETICADHYGIDNAKQKLLDFLVPYQLSTWENKEFQDLIVSSREKAPYIPLDEGAKLYSIY